MEAEDDVGEGAWAGWTTTAEGATKVGLEVGKAVCMRSIGEVERHGDGACGWGIAATESTRVSAASSRRA